MKKLLVLVLALVMALAMVCTASAETRTYAMAGVADAEGNVLASVTDDMQQVLDAEGNDITDQWPILVFACDDEAMTGTFGYEDDMAACTLEQVSEENGALVFTATFEDGSQMSICYVSENDAFAFTDESGYIYTLINIG